MTSRITVGSTLRGRLDSLILGLHFRYDWIKGNDNTNLRWGGVKLHWGYEFNQSQIVYEQDIDKQINVIDDVADLVEPAETGTPEYRVKLSLIQSHLKYPLTSGCFNFLVFMVASAQTSVTVRPKEKAYWMEMSPPSFVLITASAVEEPHLKSMPGQSGCGWKSESHFVTWFYRSASESPLH